MKRIRSARTSTVLPVAAFGGLMLAVAWDNGTLHRLRLAFEALPLPDPAANGWPLLLLVILTGCALWWRLSRPLRPPLEAYLDNEKWPADAGEVGPADDGSWCKGRPVEVDLTDLTHRAFISPPRQTYPPVQFEDLVGEPNSVDGGRS